MENHVFLCFPIEVHIQVIKTGNIVVYIFLLREGHANNNDQNYGKIVKIWNHGSVSSRDNFKKYIFYFLMNGKSSFLKRNIK